MNQRIFTDVFSAIVDLVKVKYDTVNGVKPTYLYGHYQAIADELADMSDSDKSELRYPLIILGIDPDYREVEKSDGVYDVSFNCWIVEETKVEFYTSERFEDVYKAVLFPIYEYLKDEMVDSPFLGAQGVSELGAEVKLYPYWGTESNQGSEKQIINDPLDAIRVKFTNLEVYYDNC